jgi:SSS family solute:Na+ symporter
VLTFLITIATRRTKTDEELKGLVYSLTPRIRDDAARWYQKPGFVAALVGIMALALSLMFW